VWQVTGVVGSFQDGRAAGEIKSLLKKEPGRVIGWPGMINQWILLSVSVKGIS
jgi:hypothetical protein